MICGTATLDVKSQFVVGRVDLSKKIVLRGGKLDFKNMPQGVKLRFEGIFCEPPEKLG